MLEVRAPDHQCVHSLEDILVQRPRVMCTPAKLLADVYVNPKARFQLCYPVYRVCGQGSKLFRVPEIGIRALQGRAAKPDLGTLYLSASQELVTWSNAEAWLKVLRSWSFTQGLGRHMCWILFTCTRRT